MTLFDKNPCATPFAIWSKMTDFEYSQKKFSFKNDHFWQKSMFFLSEFLLREHTFAEDSLCVFFWVVARLLEVSRLIFMQCKHRKYKSKSKLVRTWRSIFSITLIIIVESTEIVFLKLVNQSILNNLTWAKHGWIKFKIYEGGLNLNWKRTTFSCTNIRRVHVNISLFCEEILEQSDYVQVFLCCGVF